MNKNELYVKALEDLIDYTKANPEKVEEFFARVKEIKEQMYQDFDEIRNGTFKPDTTRAEPRSLQLAEKLLKEE